MQNKSDGIDLLVGAENWKAAAIAIAIITPCLCSFTFPWVFAAGTDEAMLHRVQIVGAAAAFGVALITFCTVVWKGMISTQQAMLQRIQIERLTDQIAETAKANSADFLQKGAELLAETGKPAHVSAGIATLGSVAGDIHDRFGVQAMNLLAEYVQDNGASSHRPTKVKSAIGLLNSVWESTGRRAELSLRFEAPQESRTTWEMIFWAAKISYREGIITGEDFTAMGSDESSPRMAFFGVSFNRCKIFKTRGVNFFDCKFLACEIAEISPLMLTQNTFERCDFSGAMVTGMANPFPDLKSGGNWYKSGSPPTWKTRRGAATDWSTVLLDQRPARPMLPRRRPIED